jgi:hypothetical protein
MPESPQIPRVTASAPNPTPAPTRVPTQLLQVLDWVRGAGSRTSFEEMSHVCRGKFAAQCALHRVLE